MKKFMAIYRGSPQKGNNDWNGLSPEKMQERIQQGMEAWGKWMQRYSSQIIDPGGPLGKTIQANKEGISPIVNRDTGYVIIEAASHEDAAKMFLNHPHFSVFPGENVEIMECLPIPGKEK